MDDDTASGRTRDLESRVGHFFDLTPEAVLDAVEQLGERTTGLCYPLNSLENRVYEVELVDRTRLVGKFYRPDRWSAETIQDEHMLLAALREADVPVCAPLAIEGDSTLGRTDRGILFALFPRTGGRAVEELSGDQYQQLGRLIGRIHNVAASLDLRHRPEISPRSYGTECLQIILDRTSMSEGIRARYVDAVERLVQVGQRRFQGVATHVVHGDCHRGNLLAGPDGWFFLDFDDCATGPAVQDLWLLLPARRADCAQEMEAMVSGYQQFRALDRTSLELMEVLRGLRYVRYAAWVAARFDDPAFKRAFPDFGTDRYWQGQLQDLHEQLAVLEREDGLHTF